MAALLRIALLFGGVSSEHEVSCVSAQNFMDHLSAKPERYSVLPIYIDRKGEWFLFDGPSDQVRNAYKRTYSTSVLIAPGKRSQSICLAKDSGLVTVPIDAAIPVLHGLNGEDGTIQGLFEMARIPYAGCNVIASALAMDKVFTKKIVSHLGIRQADYFAFREADICTHLEETVRAVEEKFDYPVFVKPSRAGSSVGVTKAADRDELCEGLKKALREDRIVLVEENIVGHEVECGVLGTPAGGLTVSDVGEVLAADEFYSYDAKYSNADSKTVIPAHIPEKARQEIRRCAEAIFSAIDGEGLARVDFFIEKGTDEVVFNEINTFPGFTPISMWPMLLDQVGVDADTQIAELIRIAMERKFTYGS